MFLNQKLKNHLSYLLSCKGSIIYITPVSYKIPRENRAAQGYEVSKFRQTLISAAKWCMKYFPFLFVLRRWPTPQEIEKAHGKGKLSRFNPSLASQPCGGDILFINDVSLLQDAEKIQLLKLLELLGMKPHYFMHLRSDVNAGKFFHRSSMWKGHHAPSKNIVLEEVCLAVDHTFCFLFVFM